MFGGGPSMTAPTPVLPPEPPTPPSFASASVQGAGARQRKTPGAAGGTILTSGQGDLLPANTAKKTLLGQ